MISTGNRSKLIFFWDYDTQWGADRSRGPRGPKDWGHLEFENTERLLELHSEYEVPACFAVVGAAALPGERPYHDPDQIRRIHAAGHEVASHTLYHEWLPSVGRQELLYTLHRSKDALEQCIGAPVVSFVPPYNQPFDHPRGWSFSLSERREAGRTRTDLSDLCEALRETGYHFCRVAYRPVYQRLAEHLLRRRLDRPRQLETIAGIKCVRLNNRAGFGQATVTMLRRCVEGGGLVVTHGHPHSLRADNAQHEDLLVPFLQQVRQLSRRKLIQICLPRELV